MLPFFLIAAVGTGLQVTTGPVERDSATGVLRVTATVEWQNGWRTSRNHDAVWLFAKVRAPQASWRHARLVSVTPLPGNSRIACQLAADRVGSFCAPALEHRGAVSAQVVLVLDTPNLPAAQRGAVEARVHGIEMVYIPAGPFSIGDPDPRSVEFAAYYRSNADGGHDGPYRITSEAAIRVAPEAGALYYRANTPQYEGDRQGPVPETFPKGTRAFYIMKYELSQGLYTEFLNSLAYDATYFRAIHGGLHYYDERGTIRLDHDTYRADRPARPANWVSWDDGLAFADWAGLRPMTEFEFTKAARGPGEPGRAEFPWGTGSRERLARRMTASGDFAMSGAADEARLSDSTRDILGASFYWVMDLAGSVWERVVTPGHPRGREFRGTHGDGVLGAYGIATNRDWPAGDHEAGGYGYRGGGFYELATVGNPDRDFNPYSPVEWRRYGSWGGAPRSVAYGFRAVRTADD